MRKCCEKLAANQERRLLEAEDIEALAVLVFVVAYLGLFLWLSGLGQFR